MAKPSRTKASLDPLSVKQRAFVENVAGGMTPSKAMKAAGYKTTVPAQNAAVLLENPAVRNELACLQRANRERNQVTRDEVISGLKEAIKDAKLTSDPMAQISGWREIAKMCGLYEPTRHEVTLAPELTQLREQVKTLPTERLLELAGPNVLDAEFKLIEDDNDDDSSG